jgi:hypothetical protein
MNRIDCLRHYQTDGELTMCQRRITQVVGLALGALFTSDRDNEYMMIDATIVRAHQHSAGSQKKARKRSADHAAD